TGAPPTWIASPDTAPEATSITDTVPGPLPLPRMLVTKADAPLGKKAIPRGLVPTRIVPFAERLATSITDTDPPLPLLPYARVPFGDTAIPAGLLPTSIDLMTVRSAARITDTVLLPLLPTNTMLESGVTATARGRARMFWSLTSTESTSSLLAVAIT